MAELICDWENVGKYVVWKERPKSWKIVDQIASLGLNVENVCACV